MMKTACCVCLFILFLLFVVPVLLFVGLNYTQINEIRKINYELNNDNTSVNNETSPSSTSPNPDIDNDDVFVREDVTPQSVEAVETTSTANEHVETAEKRVPARTTLYVDAPKPMKLERDEKVKEKPAGDVFEEEEEEEYVIKKKVKSTIETPHDQ